MRWMRTGALRCSNWNPSEKFEKRQNAANLCVFSYLQQASQASDVGSIPIARSINLVDSVALPLLRLENGANRPKFWTQLGPNFSPTGS
jgi:hypothetical protein